MYIIYKHTILYKIYSHMNKRIIMRIFRYYFLCFYKKKNRVVLF